MNITHLRLWCRTHDLVVQVKVDKTLYQIDANGLSCQSPESGERRVRESQIAEIFEQNPELSLVVSKRSLQGLGQGNTWTLDELRDAVGA